MKIKTGDLISFPKGCKEHRICGLSTFIENACVLFSCRFLFSKFKSERLWLMELNCTASIHKKQTSKPPELSKQNKTR